MKEVFQLQNPWRYSNNYKFYFAKRNILPELIKNLKNKKILGLIGSRQVGKSSLLYLLIEHLLNSKVNVKNIFYFNLDNFTLHELFENISTLFDFIGQERGRVYIFIDEIQRLKNPGLFLKEIYDLNLNIKIIYSGSSQIEIKSKLKEHLVGRVRQFEIQRLSFGEYLAFRKPITKKEAFEEYIIHGGYPEVALSKNNNEKKLILRDIYQAYIQKDIIELLHVENPTAFNKLLILLAHQIGSLLNIENLAGNLKIKRKEVEKYISILENTFIIKRIYPFYKNYKKEITKTPKIYFLDLGLRNLLLKDFFPTDLRDDKGKLFENFYFLELLHQDPYALNTINYWRTTNQTEIDFIIKSEKSLQAIETKWDKISTPKSFYTLKTYYPKIKTKVISKNNILNS